MTGPNRTGPPDRTPAPPPDLSGWTIGVIGLGTMGAGMAGRLAETGAALRVFNRTGIRARGLADEIGARAVPSPAEAAGGADLTLVSVADDDALERVVTGPSGVLEADRPPRVLVNTTTVAPDTARKLAAELPLLDVGILGNGEHARGGSLRCYVGGGADLTDRARPVLEALAQQILHVGGVGDGMRLKLAMNLLMAIEMQALGEVTAFGVAQGLDRQAVLDAVLESGFAAPVMRFKGRRMKAGDYGRPDFRLRLMAKDLTLARREAEAAGAVLPMTAAVAESHLSAVADGIGEADCAAIARFLEGLR